MKYKKKLIALQQRINWWNALKNKQGFTKPGSIKKS